MSPSISPRRALVFGLLAAAIPALYSALTMGLADDLLLRTWLGGGLVPGRMLAEPWRMVTAPLLHLDGAHLAVNGALLVALGAAGAIRLGALRAALVAVGAAWIGCTASVLSAQGWAAGASGAVFGLLGAVTVLVVRERRRGALWLVLLAGSLWWAVPADKAAHLGGLLGGALLALLPLSERVVRRTMQAVAVVALLGLLGAGRHMINADDVPQSWVTRDGLSVPAGWSPGLPIPPCTAAWTDGLSTLCRAAEAPADIPGVRASALPGGGHLLDHAVSPAARRYRAPLFASALERAVNMTAGPPSGAGRP